MLLSIAMPHTAHCVLYVCFTGFALYQMMEQQLENAKDAHNERQAQIQDEERKTVGCWVRVRDGSYTTAAYQ